MQISGCGTIFTPEPRTLNLEPETFKKNQDTANHLTGNL